MRLRFRKLYFLIYLVAPLALLSSLTVSAADLVISIGTPASNASGPLLAGANVVYSHEDIRTWQDGEKIQALIDSGINNLRYPGGHLVSFWDWEFPYHNAYANFWDPSYIAQLTEALGRMSFEQSMPTAWAWKIFWPFVGKSAPNRWSVSICFRDTEMGENRTPLIKPSDLSSGA